MRASPPTVLYVEDDEADRFFMERAFLSAGLGANLKTVNDGQAAINYLSGAGKYSDRFKYPFPDLVLLDLNLPLVSGFSVLEWVRQQPACAALTVIVFSASNHEDDRVRSNTLGAQDFWLKPGSGLQYSSVVARLREQWLSPAEKSPPSPH